MQFSDEALEELRAIYREDLGVEINQDEAIEIGTRLMDIMRLLLLPLPSSTGRPQEPPGL